MELKDEILQLLQEADPSITARMELAQEFARHLAGFTEAWATNSENIDAYEQWLTQWVRSDVAAVSAGDEYSADSSAVARR